MTQPITLRSGGHAIEGLLEVPEAPLALIVLADASGRGGFSFRNQWLLEYFARTQFAGLLVDLCSAAGTCLSPATARTRTEELAATLLASIDGATRVKQVRGLAVGLLGAGAGAEPILLAAASQPSSVRALVLRGGHCELPAQVLGEIRVPTLMIVGAHDDGLIKHGRQIVGSTGGEGQLNIVARATSRFEEPGAFERAAVMAESWFLQYLKAW